MLRPYNEVLCNMTELYLKVWVGVYLKGFLSNYSKKGDIQR